MRGVKGNLKLIDEGGGRESRKGQEVGGKRPYRLSPYNISTIAKIYRFRSQQLRIQGEVLAEHIAKTSFYRSIWAIWVIFTICST
jgi:hypothetical protein